MNAQGPAVTIRIDAGAPTLAHVEARLPGTIETGKQALSSFMTETAGVSKLERRISNLTVSPSVNNTGVWSYVADLKPIVHPQAAAHISWLSARGGILVLDDILPQDAGGNRKRPVTVSLVLPAGWQVFTTEHVVSPGRIEVNDIASAAIYVGTGWRAKDVALGDMTVRTLISDSWQFTDIEFEQMITEIAKSYQKLFTSSPAPTVQVGIYRFSFAVTSGQWEADTRGSTVTIASSDMPFKSQSAQRLHEQLRHELFHLWIPNAVNLTGSYDWFYEGFALYQSLKLGVAVGRIRFADMLDTLSRAYMIDSTDTSRSSLIDASRRRWVDSGITVYARGMLVAFLTDAALLEASRGKYSTDDLVKQLYVGNSVSAKKDGNTAILAAMRQHPELIPIIDGYITGTKPVDWSSLISALALEEHRNGREVVLSVALKPSGRQKDLLRKLGYNNGQ